jgi:hypothetical protein
MFEKVNEKQRQLENDVRVEVDKEKLWEHVEYLCGLGEKFAGEHESKMAVDYFKKSVQAEGVPIEIYEFDSYVSFPSHDRSKDAHLELIKPIYHKIQCQSHAMSGSTHPIELELIDVGAGDLKDYEGKEVKGKAVLVDFAALWAPERLWIAQEKGAAAQITISGDPVIHDMIVTTIWGTPTDKTSRRIPKIPIVSVISDDGKKLRDLCRNENVTIKLDVNIWKGWKKVQLPVVTIKGTEYPDEYFLVHGHFCSWGDGMTDNVGGNAQFIEMAKIFWKFRDNLKRGIKIAWWPGHSQGRYSGSTWFVDSFWEDLHKNCICQMNIDSPGVLGAILWRASASSELKEFNEYNIKEFSEGFIGEEIPTRNSTWVFRAGDQSFTGIGIPRLGCGMSIPADSPHKGKTTGGGGGGWWWHTLQDTIDKGDKERLPLPMLVNMTSILRLCNTNVLPYYYSPTANDFIDTLLNLQKASQNTVDLTNILSKAKILKEKSELLEEHLKNSLFDVKAVNRSINKQLLKISRILQPAFCNDVDRFQQDLAIRIPPLPRLQPIRELAGMDQTSNEARFLKTGLIREINKVSHALSESTELIEELLLIT